VRRAAFVTGLAITSVVAWAAAAQAPPPDPLTPTQIIATSRPRAGLASFPNPAFAKRIQGWATVVCRINTGGGLEDCKAEDEEPAGWGFGDAAVRIAEREVRLGLKDRQGQPTPGRQFRFTHQFFLPAKWAKTAMPPLRGHVGPDGLRYRTISPPRAAALQKCARDLDPGTYVVVCKSRTDDTLGECIAVEGPKLDDPRYAAAAVCAVQTARYRVTDAAERPVAGAEVRISLDWTR
jgi:hypothetical protein